MNALRRDCGRARLSHRNQFSDSRPAVSKMRLERSVYHISMDGYCFLKSFLVKGVCLCTHTYPSWVADKNFWVPLLQGCLSLILATRKQTYFLIWVIFNAVLGEGGIFHSSKAAERRELSSSLPLGKWVGLGQMDALTCNFECLAPDTDRDDGETRWW